MKKYIVALIIFICLLGTFFVNCFALVPAGPAWVNFLDMGTQRYVDVDVLPSSPTTLKDGLILPNNGELGITFAWESEAEYFPVGQYVSLRLSASNFDFSHLRAGEAYYFSGIGRADTIEGDLLEFYGIGIYLYYGASSLFANGTTPMIWNEQYNSATTVVIQGFVRGKENSSEISNVNRIVFSNMGILQGIPITNPTAQFEPFNEDWFYSESYQDGYNAGLSEGESVKNYQKGYDEGYTRGEDKGYALGLADGASAQGGTFRDWSLWLVTATGSFFSFEIFPNFTIGGLLASIISIGVLLAFLKYFAGG